MPCGFKSVSSPGNRNASKVDRHETHDKEKSYEEAGQFLRTDKFEAHRCHKREGDEEEETIQGYDTAVLAKLYETFLEKLIVVQLVKKQSVSFGT
jgi:hypothetical protein